MSTLDSSPPDIDVVVDGLAATSLQDQSSPPAKGDVLKQPPSPRSMRIYTRPELLFLINSPLVKPPPNMPELKLWFGETEQALAKKETDPSTPNSARERRFRRDVDDGDASSRPSFRSTVSQPSQMGNFKHQSLRQSDRDRDRERDRDGDKDRERDIRDKEGQERLRHLSDKYDRDRLALPSPGIRNKERDTAPHLGGSSNKQGQPSNTPRRGDPREPTKKKVVEASEDWRRGTESARSAREDRADSTRREDRDAVRSRARDSSKSRRELSSTRRDRERDDIKDRDKASRGDREDDQEDPRRWRDDGKREERIAARRGGERHGDKDRTRDKTHHEPGWDVQGDRRWAAGEDRDGRYKRPTAREKKQGSAAEDGKEREERWDHDREREKEPAWMDTYIPDGPAPGILGAKGADGELDGIQAWKKGLKEKEQKEKGSAGSTKSYPDIITNTSDEAVAEGEKELDEIQLFKLLMKKEKEKKKYSGTDDLPNATEVKASMNAANNGDELGNHEGNPNKFEKNSFVKALEPTEHTSKPDIFIAENAATNSRSLLSVLGAIDFGIPSTTVADISAEQSRMLSSSKPNPKSPPLDISSFNEDSNPAQFNPPPGSRLLAFGRPPAKSPVPLSGSGLQQQNGIIRDINGDHPSNQTMNSEIPRSQPSFSASEPTRPYALEEQVSLSSLADAHRRLGNGFSQIAGPLQHDSSLDNNSAPYALGKGSRFAKFFDGKAKDGAIPIMKQQASVGFSSSSPNPYARQEQGPFGGMVGAANDNRAMEDIFAMLNNSSQGQRSNMALPSMSNIPTQVQNNPNPQQSIISNRLEPLYESRIDDRSFVPDGMVPGLRPAVHPRGRENIGLFSDSGDDYMHRLVQQQQHQQHQQQQQQQQQHRGLDSLYPGTVAPGYNPQVGRGIGLPLHQGQYRGGPSPNLNQQNMPVVSQHRLPPGLANLGGRPPHEPSHFLGLPALPGNLPNGPLLQQQQNFNNFNANNNMGYGGQMRGPMLHQIPNPAGQLGGGNHLNTTDVRLPVHGQVQGMGVPGVRGLHGGFNPQQGLQSLPGVRQQPQQPHLPPSMLPHVLPPHMQQPHMQQQGHSGANTHDLMALLLGGPHRE